MLNLLSERNCETAALEQLLSANRNAWSCYVRSVSSSEDWSLQAGESLKT